MNVARQEAFGGENYEASGEEFMYSLLDSVTGPLMLNTVGFGTSYERAELAKNPVEHVMMSLLPPGGFMENTGKSISKAIREEDSDALAEIVTKLPIYKQWEDLLTDS